MADNPQGGLPDIKFLNAFVEHIFNGAHFGGHFTTSTRYGGNLAAAMAAVVKPGVVYHNGQFIYVTANTSGEVGIRDCLADGSFEQWSGGSLVYWSAG